MMNKKKTTVTTITLNPAIDETIILENLLPGTVMRAQSVHFSPGGKGINVARCLANLPGFAITVTGLLGRENSQIFEKTFSEMQLVNHFIYQDGPTRTNIKLLTQNQTSDINLPGQAATTELLQQIEMIVAKVTDEFLVLSGSLPPNCPNDFYLNLITQQKNNQSAILVDCSGLPLKLILEAKLPLFCIKPNRDELAEYVGKPLETREEILAEARKLHDTGIELIVVSMGAEGALFINKEGAIHTQLPLDSIGTTVGAGDAMVAGIIAAQSERQELDRVGLENLARKATVFAAKKLLNNKNDKINSQPIPNSVTLDEQLSERIVHQFLN